MNSWEMISCSTEGDDISVQAVGVGRDGPCRERKVSERRQGTR